MSAKEWDTLKLSEELKESDAVPKYVERWDFPRKINRKVCQNKVLLIRKRFKQMKEFDEKFSLKTLTGDPKNITGIFSKLEVLIFGG